MNKNIRYLFLYGIIGSFSAALDFSVYTVIVEIVGIHYILSNCISVTLGITTSFFLNRNINFRIKDKTKLRFSLFLVVGFCGMLVSNVLLFCLVDVCKQNELLSKIASVIIVALFQFVFNRYITFNPSKI